MVISFLACFARLCSGVDLFAKWERGFHPALDEEGIARRIDLAQPGERDASDQTDLVIAIAGSSA